MKIDLENIQYYAVKHLFLDRGYIDVNDTAFFQYPK